MGNLVMIDPIEIPLTDDEVSIITELLEHRLLTAELGD